MNENDTDINPIREQKSGTNITGKLLVIFLLILVMSSGLLYYAQTPMFFYGSLGISVGILLLILYIAFFLTSGKPQLFTDDQIIASSTNKNTAIGSGSESGLERVFEAEQQFIDSRKKRNGHKQKEKQKKAKSKITLAKTKKNLGEDVTNGKDNRSIDDITTIEELVAKKKKIEKKGTKKRKRSTVKDVRIGSVSIEESEFKERYEIRKKDDDKMGYTGTEKVTTFLCPTCGSKELFYEAGLISGYKYHCKDCDYIGSFVIEKDFQVNSTNS